jgi:hypothetical protein
MSGMSRRLPLRRIVGKHKQLPPAVGGLNTRDALPSMPPQDAIVLDNFFPERSYTMLRRGSAEWSTGFTSPVDSLLEYVGAARLFFAASGDGIYNITAGGAATSAVVTSLTNARWQSVMFSNAGGTYLLAVNGADGLRSFDGTTWATQSVTGPGQCFQVTTWANRVWLAENGTARAWYLPTNAITGTANSVNLGGVWRKGGVLRTILAAGYESMGTGLNDYIGFLSSNGELAVYRGTDPATAANFAMVGVFVLPQPVGNRCIVQFGDDVLILTQDGLVSLKSIIQTDPSNARLSAVSDKISVSLQQQYETLGGLFGWEVALYPTAHMLLVNVPLSAGAVQYVMNTLSGSWCRFTGWSANCFGRFGDNLYFGTGTEVVRAWTGTSDQGAAIVATESKAFTQLKDEGQSKRVTMVRPLITANAAPGGGLFVNMDYERQSITAPYTETAAVALWDTALWDVDVWGGSDISVRDWSGVSGIGYAVSIGYTVRSLGLAMNINGYDVMYEPAGRPGL